MDKWTLKGIPVSKFDLGITTLTNIKHTYVINAYVHDKILVMDIYDTSNVIKYRIFQSKTEFITLEGSKWRQSKLSNLIDWYFHPTFIALKNSAEVIKKYLKTDADAIEAIYSAQKSIRQAELDNSHKSELDLIDVYMKPVRDVPKDFEKWINDVVLLESRYIIYEYKKTPIMPGKCTHCKNDVLVNKPKHNLPGVCPNCRSRVIFKAWGKFNNVIDHGDAQLVQKHPEGVIVREFYVTKTYTRNHSVVSYLEKNRTIIGKEINHFAWDVYKQNGPVRWCIDKRYWNLDIGPIYTKNLKRELKGTDFKYSGLTEMINSGHQFMAMTYLETYRTGHALEYLSKLKLFNIIKALLSGLSSPDINLQGKSPLAVLKINKQNLNRAISIDANYTELKLLQISESEGVSIPDEFLKEIAKNYDYQLDTFIELSKLSTIHQLLKYIKKHNARLSDYRDYISMAKELNWNITDRFILFPRHFKRAHDQAQELIQVKETYAENLIIQKMYQDLNKQLSFTTEEYSIRLPRTAKEIIREGHELHHCVGGYIHSVANGNTLILLIRKKDEPHNPYYTLELDPKEKQVRQVRGNKNCNPSEEVNKLVEDYKKNLNKIKVNIAC